MSTLLALLLAGCGATAEPSGVVCPSLPVHARAAVVLSSGLGAGTFDVTLAKDGGAAESCTITVGGVEGIDDKSVPGMVRGPLTQTSTTCAGVTVGTINDDGTVHSLDVEGTPATFTLALAQGGRSLGSLTATPDYTPDACGFIEPTLQFAVTP